MILNWPSVRTKRKLSLSRLCLAFYWQLTIRLDKEEQDWVAEAPLAVNNMRLKLSLKLDCLSINVPDEQHLIVSGLRN